MISDSVTIGKRSNVCRGSSWHALKYHPFQIYRSFSAHAQLYTLWWARHQGKMAKVDKRAVLSACTRGDLRYLQRFKSQNLQFIDDERHDKCTTLHIAAV